MELTSSQRNEKNTLVTEVKKAIASLDNSILALGFLRLNTKKDGSERKNFTSNFAMGDLPESWGSGNGGYTYRYVTVDKTHDFYGNTSGYQVKISCIDKGELCDRAIESFDFYFGFNYNNVYDWVCANWPDFKWKEGTNRVPLVEPTAEQVLLGITGPYLDSLKRDRQEHLDTLAAIEGGGFEELIQFANQCVALREKFKGMPRLYQYIDHKLLGNSIDFLAND